METIVINDKTFVIRKGNDLCNKCLFYRNSKYPNAHRYCLKTKCIGFITFIIIREANIIDKIRLWLKKKIKK